MTTFPQAAAASKTAYFDRVFALEGIEILSRAKGGDGRTVEAYAAVFNQPTEVHDEHGDYMEDVHPTAFNRTLSNGAVKRALVLYNHGMSVVNGKPDSLAQVPLGSPLEIKADGKGLMTITRYNKSPLADSVLEAIKNDDIRGQSFRGRIFKSTPDGPIRHSRAGGALPKVTRMELGLSDYGPTPRPYYEGARIVAVRSAHEVFSEISGFDSEELAELGRLILRATHLDEDDSASGTATPHSGPGTAEPSRERHSGRTNALRLRAEALFSGV